MSFIKQLQNKPRRIKIKILWASVVIIMALVIFVWLIFLQYSLKTSIINKAIIQKAPKEQSLPSLFGSLGNDISILKSSLFDAVRNLKGKKGNKRKFKVEIKYPASQKFPE